MNPPNDQPEPQPLAPRADLSQRGRVSFGLLLRLAWLDLWHERILTACVVVALTAVLAPLLILLSLKYGLVETLRARLVTDPRNREIRPQTSEVFTLADIESLRQRPDVRFIIPLTRTISGNVQVSLPGAPGARLDTEISPTGDGDPLLEENGTRVPQAAECVLSEALYHRLSASGNVGQLLVHAARQSATGMQTASTMLTVVGRASERATMRETVFVPLGFLEEVESWLEGNPVPRLGWPGDGSGVSPVAEEIIVPTTRPLDAVEKAALLVNTGFSEVKEMSREELARLMAVPAGSTAFYRFITSEQRKDDPADKSTVTRFRSSLPPVAGDIFGYCRPMELALSYADGSALRTAKFRVRPEIINSPAKKPLPVAVPVKPAPAVAAKPPAAPPPALESGPPPPADAVTKPALPVAAAEPAGPSPPPPQQLQPAMPETTGRNLTGAPPPPAPMPAVPQGQPNNFNLQVTPRAGTGAGGLRLDAQVQPLPPTSPPPKAARDDPDDDATRKGAKPSGTDKAKGKTKRRMGAEGTAVFSPDGMRYISTRSPAAPPPPSLWLPRSWNVPEGQQVQATLNTPSGPVTFPAVVALQAEEVPTCSQSLAGTLRVGMDKPIEYQPALGAFVPTRRGWPSFRLVARDIDAVQGLVDYFHARRMNVLTKADRIRDVRELDQYTSYVFWIVAAVGLTGAVGALLASLIAAVERKRRSLGVLRLLGLRRRSLIRMPFYQSALVVSASVGLAVLAWWWVSRFISRFTARYLEAGETLAALPAHYLFTLWAGALVIATLASFIAGLRVMRVDPSEAIRDE